MADPYKGVYGVLEFPPYQFQEYPKWVDINGQRVLVESHAIELKKIMEADAPENVEPTAVELENEALKAYIAKLEAEARNGTQASDTDAKVATEAKAVAPTEQSGAAAGPALTLADVLATPADTTKVVKK